MRRAGEKRRKAEVLRTDEQYGLISGVCKLVQRSNREMKCKMVLYTSVSHVLLLSEVRILQRGDSRIIRE
jgi:hypothetical protein